MSKIIIPRPVATVSHCRSGVVTVHRVTFGALASWFVTPEVGEKDGAAWMPAEIECGPRTNERVKSIGFLVLDVEGKAEPVNDEHGETLRDLHNDIIKRLTGPAAPDVDAMLAELTLQGWRCALHTTYSHQLESPRYRLIFDLTRPLTPAELKPLGLHVARLLGISECFDAACLDAARLFYLPRCPSEERKQLYRHAVLDGDSMPVDDLLSEMGLIEKAINTSLEKRTLPQSTSVIDQFNTQNDIASILKKHGYVAKSGGRWLWPESTTGAPGVRLLPEAGRGERVYSSHGGDPLNDTHAHDAFDCMRILEHAGDTSAAVKDAADRLGLAGGSAPRCEQPGGAEMTAQPEQLLQPISITDVITHPSPPQVFIWDPYVPAGEVTLFSADGGAGKSFIGLMLAVSVAIGRPLFGAPVERRRALFVSLEDKGHTVRRRLASICGEWKIDPAHLETWLFCVDGTAETELFSTESRSSGATTATYAELRDLIPREGIGLVIIDNASNAFGGDEIKRREVNRFIRSLIKLIADGVAVLLLGHVDKATSRGAKNGGQSYSGSTAWHNAVRSRIALSRLEDRSLLLVHEKGNHSYQQAEGMKLEWPKHQLPVLAGGDSASDANDHQMDGFLDKERYPKLLAMIDEYASRKVFCHPANNSPSSVYAKLKSDPIFKAMRIKRDDVNRLLTHFDREKWIELEEYRTTDRKLHDRWTVTADGRAVAGLDPLPAPSAPSAPSELDGTHGTVPQSEPTSTVPSAPSGAGGMGVRARTKKNLLGALNANLITADLSATKPVIKRGRPRKTPELPNVKAAAKGGRKAKSTKRKPAG